jgi:hypothetical protein
MHGRRYAVLIAASRFPDEPRLFPLACPENDVADLDHLLRDESLGGFTATSVLANRPHHEVLRTINTVLKRAERDDLVLIYYSGHGKLDEAGHLYLATADTTAEVLESTAVPVSRIRELVSLSHCTKSVLILDCCFAGAVEKAFLRGSVDDQLKIVSQGRGTYIMTAATGIQTAQEKEGDRNGVFTKHLLNGIRGGAADEDGDGYISAGELYNYVHREVAAESPQEPMKWDLNVRGELIIAKSGTSPHLERRSRIRAKLFELADQGILPDSVLAKALDVLALRPVELVGPSREYDRLLERLSKGEIAIGPFMDAWLKVGPPVERDRKPPPDSPTKGPTKRPDPPRPEPESFMAAIGTLLAAMFPGFAALIRWLAAATARQSQPATMPLGAVPPVSGVFADRPPRGGRRPPPAATASAGSERTPAVAGLGVAVGWLAACWMILVISAAMFDGAGASFTGDSYDAVPSGVVFGTIIAQLGTIILWRRRIGKSGVLARAVFTLTLVGAAGVAFFMMAQF